MSDCFPGVVHLPTYLLGTLIVILLPGPNSLFVLGTAVRGGVRKGYQAACGVFLGDTVLTVLASAGVASLLRAFPALFFLMKCAGGAYLAWVGLQMLLSAVRGQPGEDGVVNRAVDDSRSPLGRALLISLLNPKSILFFVAFFIQFVDPGYVPKAVPFLLLGGIAQIMSACYLSIVIFSGAKLAAAFRRHRRTRKALTSGAGALFVGFGVRLAASGIN